MLGIRVGQMFNTELLILVLWRFLERIWIRSYMPCASELSHSSFVIGTAFLTCRCQWLRFRLIFSPSPTPTMTKSEDPSATVQSKKKLIEDEQMRDDATSKPLQLQRRRVWRACESCRYVLIVLHHHYQPSLSYFFIRRKKIKCDGCEPTCSQCSISSSQCTWLQTKDRAALSRQYDPGLFLSCTGSDYSNLVMYRNSKLDFYTWNLCSLRSPQLLNSIRLRRLPVQLLQISRHPLILRHWRQRHRYCAL